MFRMLASAAACLACTAALAQDGAIGPRAGPDAPLPYLQPSAEDGFISRAIRDGRLHHRDFAAAFDDASPGCGGNIEPFHAVDVFFSKHGATFGFGTLPTSRSVPGPPDGTGWVKGVWQKVTPAGELSVSTLVAPGGAGYVGLASFPSCAIQIDFQKSVLRDGHWMPARPLQIGEVADRDEREARHYGLQPADRRGSMDFMFEAADGDGCVQGSGFVVIRPHSVLSELGNRFDGTVRRGGPTDYSNDYTIERGNCRYMISILQYAKDEGGALRPVPVSKVFAAFAGPPTP